MTARPPIEQDAETHFQHAIVLWIRWMHAPVGADGEGYAKRDSVCGMMPSNYMVTDEDFDVIYDNNDARIGSIVDACVESLMPTERGAILRHYGFMRVWPFLNLSYQETLELAMCVLRRLVAKRC